MRYSEAKRGLLLIFMMILRIYWLSWFCTFVFKLIWSFYVLSSSGFLSFYVCFGFRLDILGVLYKWGSSGVLGYLKTLVFDQLFLLELLTVFSLWWFHRNDLLVCRVMMSLMFLDMIQDNGFHWQGRLSFFAFDLSF